MHVFIYWGSSWLQQLCVAKERSDLSATLATALQREISGSETERWKSENREAIQILNRMVEERGLFSDDHRAF